MPHGARKQSESGFYHVVSKGINAQILFEDDADKLLYMRLLREAKELTGMRIHAYCLMGNHVHLAVEDTERRLSEFLKYVHERYGMEYSRKHGHVGGVFVKTCWSEPIETDEHLLCAVRYIHANPANAGICKAAAYQWSSAQEYLGREGITDTTMVLDMCGGVQGFVRFSQPENATLLPFPGSRLTKHMSETEECMVATDVLGFDPLCLGQKSKEERDAGIALLKTRGFSQRCIMRLTGLGRRIVHNA